jgi:hypothetical protein
MFNFFRKPVVDAAALAETLWQEDKKLAAMYVESGFPLEETLFFICFATDLSIHKVLTSEQSKSALRGAFYPYIFDFAVERHCKRPPLGKWQDGSNFWEPHTPQCESDDVSLIVLERFQLYSEAMTRPWGKGKSSPVALMLAGLCHTRDLSFVLPANMLFVNHFIASQKFLKSLRISDK